MEKSRAGVLQVLILLAVFGVLAVPDAFAAPLWLNGRDLYSSQGGGRDFKPGDIITVQISEESSAQQAATTNTQDDTSLEVKSSPPIPAFKKYFNKFVGKNQVTNSWKGNGTTTRSGKLAGTVTAQILEVMPNGNLLVEGSRSIRVNKETQILRVRGVARPQDIDTANSISSKLLADAEIKYEGKGSVGSTQRPSIFTKIANFVF